MWPLLSDHISCADVIIHVNIAIHNIDCFAQLLYHSLCSYLPRHNKENKKFAHVTIPCGGSNQLKSHLDVTLFFACFISNAESHTVLSLLCKSYSNIHIASLIPRPCPAFRLLHRLCVGRAWEQGYYIATHKKYVCMSWRYCTTLLRNVTCDDILPLSVLLFG